MAKVFNFSKSGHTANIHTKGLLNARLPPYTVPNKYLCLASDHFSLCKSRTSFDSVALQQTRTTWAVVVVKWSACSPSTPTFRVRIPLRSTIFFL